MLPIKQFLPISLAEMKTVKLMNRTDTKFVTNRQALIKLLKLAEDDYFIQEISGINEADYHTLYFDTPDNRMYIAHQNGKKHRQKLRIRSYMDSDEHFLEVKTKNNHGRTKKKRVALDWKSGDNFKKADDNGYDFCKSMINGCRMEDYSDFLQERLWLCNDPLLPKIENRFSRITLVNKRKTERLTIDYSLSFHNIDTDKYCSLGNLVIIELKRDGLQPSPVLPLLNKLRIFPMGFSKYCMGMALTNSELKQNRFKERLRYVEHFIC